MEFLNFKLAFRNYIKNKQFTLINILGLAIGLAAFILISLVINFHFSFDKYNRNFDNIYRIDQSVEVNGEVDTYSCTPFPLGPVLQQNYAEIKKACRTRGCGEFLSTTDKRLMSYEGNGLYADSTLFEIFDFDLVHGNPDKALLTPFSVVLTEEMAHKYFPGVNPMGQTLKFQSNFQLNVTGVIKKQPENSTINPDYIVSYSTFEPVMNLKLDEIWTWCQLGTYVLLHDDTDIAALTEKIRDVQNEYHENISNNQLKLWALAKIHLQFNEDNDDRPFLYMLGIIAVFILVLACINFINLSTAYSSLRVREIGIRKISGSGKKQIVIQFLTEALVIAFIALFFALFIAELMLPMLNNLIDENLSIRFVSNPSFFVFVILSTIVVGFISGSYPAFYLSSLIPVHILKGGFNPEKRKATLRNSLVVFQFVISIALIASTIIVFQEMQLLKNKELGFNKENLLVGTIQLTGDNSLSKYEALQAELLADPRILDLTWSHTAPFRGNEFWSVTIEGHNIDEQYRINHNHVDFNYLKTFQIPLVEGRELSRNFASDVKDGSCLINEEAVRHFGWDSCGAIGKRITNDGIDYTVVGVMKDFHQFSVTAPISPYFISYTTRELGWGNVHAIRIAKEQDFSEIKEYITTRFQEYFPQDNVEFNYLEEGFDERNYGFVKVVGTLFAIFAFLAVAIAAIGLFGLVSFVIKQNSKNIGIRKVNGAHVSEVLAELNKTFLKWVVLAFFIATPVAYFFMNNWLSNFAYRVDLEWWFFCLAGLVALIVSLVTVSVQSWRAATRNPVEALRYE